MGAIDYDELFKQDAFKNLDSSSRELIKEIHREMDGKQPMEMMQILIKYSSKLKNGKQMSNDERDAMIAAVRISLPADERAKLDNLLGMLGIKGKK